MKKIIFITRKWNHDFFTKVSQGLDYESSFFREEALEHDCINTPMSFDQKEIKSIISGCRLLRNIPEETAVQRISRSYSNIFNFLNVKKPDYVISLTVDNYHLDIFHRVCINLNIEFIGLVNSLIPGYVRISANGEPNYSNQGPNLHYLSDFYASKLRPSHFEETSSYKKFFRNFKFLLRKVFFSYKYFLGDRTYHTLVNYLWHKRGEVGSLSKINSNISKSDLIFLPLQCSPECTIDYWAPVQPNNDYEQFLKNIILSFADYNFLIKEHPYYDGQRIKNFDHFLTEMDNCNVASVGESTYELFKSVDYVATLTGTTAVEALLSDKKVWLLSNSIPYFFKDVTLLPGLKNTGHVIEPTKTNKDKLMSNINKMLIPGAINLTKTLFNYTWSYNGLLNLTNSLKLYINQKEKQT